MSSRSLFYTEQQALENGLDIQIIGMKNKILKKSFSLDLGLELEEVRLLTTKLFE